MSGHGFKLFAHPLFLEQLELLEKEVDQLKKKDPKGYIRKNATKRLAAIYKLIFEIIPSNPNHSKYRQGHTLGKAYTHWFRAKFLGQYRLFFRLDMSKKVIVYTWVNDESTKRAFESKKDAYRVFESKLAQGDPPNSLDELLAAAQPIKED